MDREKLIRKIKRTKKLIKKEVWKILEDTDIVKITIVTHDEPKVVIFRNLDMIDEFKLPSKEFIPIVISVFGKYVSKLLKDIKDTAEKILQERGFNPHLSGIVSEIRNFNIEAKARLIQHIYYFSYLIPLSKFPLPLSIVSKIEKKYCKIELFDLSQLVSDNTNTLTSLIKKDDVEKLVRDIRKELFKMI